jgi:opacity protein-like surface antigen
MAFRRAATLFFSVAGLAMLGSAEAQQQPSYPIWNGFYAGVTGGYSHEKASFDASDLASSIITSPTMITGLKTSGGNLGFLGGANWQMGALVFGIEGDWSHYWLNVTKGVTVDLSPLPSASAKLSAEIDWTASLRGRFGVALGDVMVYGTAGGVAASARGDISVGGIVTPVTYSNSTILPGWVLGGGLEAQLTRNWIARGEYLHMHFGNIGSLTSGVVPVTDSVDIDTVRAALAYKF